MDLFYGRRFERTWCVMGWFSTRQSIANAFHCGRGRCQAGLFE